MLNFTAKQINNITLLLPLGGLLIMALGFSCACVSLGLFFDPAEGDAPYQMTWLLSFILLALPMILAGIVAIGFAWRRHQQDEQQTLQNLVLKIARSHQGIVTATELALNSTLPFNEAQNYLERLAARGICRLEMNQSGTTYFVFEDLQKHVPRNEQ